MKKYLGSIIAVMVVLTLSVLGFVFNGIKLSQLQLDTLLILVIVCGASVLYCFIVGELTHNNSQMDKLWSILPIAYVWIIAIKGDFNFRLLVYAILVTLWGIRLTFNFARKGAYSIKFWTGEEDYRWQVLRQKPGLNNKFTWALFDLFFISLYQNALVLAICFPALAAMGSVAPWGVFDYIGTFSASAFLLLETVADEQQWKFHQNKKKLLSEGKPLQEIEEPYSKGFNTTGIWKRSRHPNYLGEQGFWMCLYFFAIASWNVTHGFFSWTLIGPLFLVFLFLGSSAFGEGVSNSKYPEYKYYLCYVSKYLPLRKYDKEKAEAKYEKTA